MDHDQTPQTTTSVPHAPVLAARSETTRDTIEHIQVIAPSPRDSNIASSVGQPQSASTDQPLLGPASEDHPTTSRSHENAYANPERPPPSAHIRNGHGRAHSNHHGLASAIGLPFPRHNYSDVDWIVPVDEKDHSRHTLGERLKPTINNAMIERDNYAWRAKWVTHAVNIAIGLQVLLGALTTGIAAGISSAKRAQVSTAVLGGLSTLVASFLARARGSGEPELSSARAKELEQFLRDCMAFQIDHAHEYGTPGNKLDLRVLHLRRRLEEILGNPSEPPIGVTAVQALDSTRKSPSVGVTASQAYGGRPPIGGTAAQAAFV